MNIKSHDFWMRRCLELAKLGAGKVSPNPMVGALIVHNEEVIAENYHQKLGGGHAESLAIDDVLQKYGESKGKLLLAESTLYVTLEPCSHTGKTAPCALKIVEYKIPRVVIAMKDPNAKVNGKGIEILRNAGVELILNICKEEAVHLNRRFIVQHVLQRPYVILKWAQTVDGFFAPKDGVQRWITGAVSKQLVHKWRSEEDAILVGKTTALIDNPSLTQREWSGKNPIRVLIDPNLEVPSDAAVFSEDAETIVLNAIKTDIQDHCKWIELEDIQYYLPQKILFQLYLLDIQSLIIEGGAKTLQMFIDSGLFDEIRVLEGVEAWGEGIKAPIFPRKSPVKTYKSGKDLVKHYEYQKF